MAKSERFFYTDGTAALKLESAAPCTSSPSFVAFRGSNRHMSSNDAHGAQPLPSSHGLKSFAQGVLERSEMFCSLVLEDFRGVSYNMLTSSNITTLSVASAVVAILAIAIGA